MGDDLRANPWSQEMVRLPGISPVRLSVVTRNGKISWHTFRQFVICQSYRVSSHCNLYDKELSTHILGGKIICLKVVLILILEYLYIFSIFTCIILMSLR